MKAQLTITIDPALKTELLASAKASKQSVSDFIANTLKRTILVSDRKHVKISPYIMEMTSELQLPVDIEELRPYLENAEKKHQ